ncbi:MAG: DUF2442 domain-containing protein [Thermodesulfobacteriota bacterium]
MFLQVIKVACLDGYRLRLEFSDGAVRDVNLESELYGEVFEPLKDPEVFRMVRVNPDTNTIEWPNGADLAPEYLHRIGTEVKKIA